MRIAFIGGGNMGEAMLAAILEKGLSTAGNVTVIDISETRRRYLKQKYGITVTVDNRQAVVESDVVVLAVKPQQLAEAMSGLSGRLHAVQLLLSIVAGAAIGALCRGLDHNCVARVMPNTPAQIGEGISVWTATAEVSKEQKAQVGAILGAMGRQVYVNDERYLDMATAVSGSGPAYVFLFTEALTSAAVDIGLPDDMARELALETVLGSARFMQGSDRSPAELRRMVTSPGGTTAAALTRLEKGQFTELIKQAVRAAYERARELGN